MQTIHYIVLDILTLQNSSPHEAKSRLMFITGHSSMVALEKYLRDIDAALPDDYSKFLRVK